MLWMSVQTALKFPCLAVQASAQRWPRKNWPNISLQRTQERRHRDLLPGLELVGETSRGHHHQAGHHHGGGGGEEGGHSTLSALYNVVV